MSAQAAVLEAEPQKPHEVRQRLGLQRRAGLVQQLKEAFSGVEMVVVARLDRVPAGELNKLRHSLQGLQSTILMVKNSLCRLAFREIGWTPLEDTLRGTCGVSPVRGEIGTVCRLLSDFSKKHEGFILAGGIFNGQRLSTQELLGVARLPGRGVLLSQLAGICQSPLRRLATVLQGPLYSLVICLLAVPGASLYLAQFKGGDNVKGHGG